MEWRDTVSCAWGLSSIEMEEALFLIGKNSKVRALDLVSVDTFNDVKEVVARTSLSLLLSFLAGIADRG